MSGHTADFLSRYLAAFHNLKGIIVSDCQGIHICSNFEGETKNDAEKLIRTSAFLIQALNQTDSNLEKIHSKNISKVTNYYYGDYLIHIAKEKNLKFTLFFTANSTIMRARQISQDLTEAYEPLNQKIPQIKKDA